MKRYHRKRSTVRWLPDNSFLEQATFLALSNPQVHSTSKILLLGSSDTPEPRQLGGFPALASENVFVRDEPQSLIIDHIKGKLTWSIEGNDDVEGHADASGIWRYFIRSAIVIANTATHPNPGSGGDGEDAEIATYGGVDLTNISPDAHTPWVNQGSFGPEGLRCLWRRSWMLSVDWEGGAQATGTLVSNEDACPPGPYIDIKPKRLLRENEFLLALLQVTTTSGAGAGGTSGVLWSTDLRVAGHNTKRRR